MGLIGGAAPQEAVADVGWDVPNGSRTDSGATIVNVGHIDIASLLVDGALDTVINDESAGEGAVPRRPEATVLQITPRAERQVPDAAAFRFLGNAGDALWLLPETQDASLLWPGWSTEAIPADATSRGIDWSLDRITGPGEFALFDSDAFGAPRVRFDSRDGLPDTFEIPRRVHAHANWAFSAEGEYCLGFTRSTTLASGAEVSDEFTLAIAVGAVDVQGVDPTACFSAAEEQPTEPDTTPISFDELTESNTGDVRVHNGATGLRAGESMTVHVGEAFAGAWVSVWLGNSRWLGWRQVGSTGALQSRLPDDTEPGAHRLVVKDRDGKLLGWDSLLVSAPSGEGPVTPSPPVEPGTPPGPGVWDVANGTVNTAGATVLNAGHIDLASLIDLGQLDTRIIDSSTASAPVWRDVQKTVLQLLPHSRTTVPSGEQWGFLGEAGSHFYQLPQTEQAGLLWPGWSTEAISSGATTGGVTWALTDASGPGDFALWETRDFGQPRVLFDSSDDSAGANQITIPPNTHAHGAWAFSEQGNYCLSMQRSARLVDGRVASHSFVVAVAVGTADVMSVDPARCTGEVDTDPVAPPPAGSDRPGAPAPATQVAATQCVAGAMILSAGHIDYATRIVDGRLESLIGDDSGGTKVYREPSGVIMWLKPSSAVTLPSGFGEIGPAGTRVWQIPQTEDRDLVWLGWNTESLNAGNTRGSVLWSIDSIQGPAPVTVYLSGSFGGVQQIVFDSGGSYSIPLGVHAHANWAFGAEGIYRITSTQTATLADGRTSSDTETMTIVVGDVNPADAAGSGSGCGAVPNAALIADEASALESAAQSSADVAAARDRSAVVDATPRSDSTIPFAALAYGNPVSVLLGILGLLLILSAVGTGVLWSRHRREGTA
ncbi:TIGR03773 family transporter-associated surface protein [Agromyces atrinae]|uniref:TIGR03773 family transporter-associated surface protein n=1 Tax=Agromyces atrinae TaxID=592376 RepID=UPI001F588ECF|nr:TIGR03773 family transporter-associated surface protein [Agromyces atrinae]MCI2956657.1 TIGR03773 family transporter-associated surface protein [Agromyces atrinae]